LLVVFDADRKVKAVRFLKSADKDGHVKIVRDDLAFWRQWDGRAESTLGSPGTPLIVSGATLTSEAMARGLAARFGAEGMDQWFPAPLNAADVEKWYPGADSLEEKEGTYRVEKGGEMMGVVLRSSRMGISARGYNGTSDVIVCLDVEGKKVLGVGFLGSRDNEPYISDVRNEVKYADGFAGKTPEEIIAEDIRNSPSLYTSGASYTNQAVVETVREMLRRHLAAKEAGGFPWKISLALSWIVAGVFLGVHRFGNRSAVRMGFAVVSVVAGVALGWMVSQDQLIGWGGNGFGVSGILPLVALTAVAPVVPAFTGKNVYCNRICPHGAAQTLAGRVVRKRFALPLKFHFIMSRVPWLTLVVIWVLAFLVSGGAVCLLRAV
jgi:NosR/NirI family transcriptional regulator, nitrous oxide reductase regulator